MRDTCEEEGDLCGFRARIAPCVRRSVLHEGIARGQSCSITTIQHDGDSARQNYREIDRWSAMKSRINAVDVLRSARH